MEEGRGGWRRVGGFGNRVGGVGKRVGRECGGKVGGGGTDIMLFLKYYTYILLIAKGGKSMEVDHIFATLAKETNSKGDEKYLQKIGLLKKKRKKLQIKN